MRWSASGQVADVANACFALVAVYILATDWRAAWLLVLLGAVCCSPTGPTRARASAPRASNGSTGSPSWWGARSSSKPWCGRVLIEVRSTFEVGAVHLRLTHEDGTLQDWCLDEETLSVGSSALVDAVAGLAADGTVVVPRRTRDQHRAGGPRTDRGPGLRPGSPPQ